MSKIIKITDEDYFANPAVNHSLLARISCPKKARLPRPDTKALLEGRVIHCAVLEPEAFDARYTDDEIVHTISLPAWAMK